MKYNISDKVLCVKDDYNIFEVNKVYEIEDIDKDKWVKLRGSSARITTSILDKYFKLLDKENNNMYGEFCETYAPKKEKKESVHEIYNIGDIIKYKTAENPVGKYGIVVSIFEVKNDLLKDNINKTFYKVRDLYESNRAFNDVREENILESYAKR